MNVSVKSAVNGAMVEIATTLDAENSAGPVPTDVGGGVEPGGGGAAVEEAVSAGIGEIVGAGADDIAAAEVKVVLDEAAVDDDVDKTEDVGGINETVVVCVLVAVGSWTASMGTEGATSSVKIGVADGEVGAEVVSTTREVELGRALSDDADAGGSDVLVMTVELELETAASEVDEMLGAADVADMDVVVLASETLAVVLVGDAVRLTLSTDAIPASELVSPCPSVSDVAIGSFCPGTSPSLSSSYQLPSSQR
jgi:hypothetical protein